MYNRLLEISPSSSHSAIIFGPRGTGKTYWLKTNFPEAIYFDLLNAEVYQEMLADPTRLSRQIPIDFKGWVIIDEIQKAPGLFNEVHRLIEHRQLRFLLTGSSARSLRKKGVNLLAGRALTYYMHPLTTIELGSSFNLSTSLHYGQLPSIYGHENPKHYLSSYIKTYLREEVLQEGITRNLALFTRFLETASFSQGEVINYSEIAREIGSKRHTISNFFDILEDLLIAYRLPVFTKPAKRDVVAHPKFYYFDTGIYRTLRPMGPLDSNAEVDGPALETLFLQEIRAINDYFFLEMQLYYWRTRSQLEVDFIAYGENGFFAFEIKRKNKLNNKDFKSLTQFGEDYPQAKLYLLYGGERKYHFDNIEVLPFPYALTHLKEILKPQKD